MAKKKQEKKRKKQMPSMTRTPDLSVSQSIPKNLFGSASHTGNANVNSASMRSPGSQRKR